MVNIRMSVRFKWARELLEQGQCRNAFARDAEGRSVSADSPKAVCFCTMGAMRAMDCSYVHFITANALSKTERVAYLHDSSTDEENIARMRKAEEYCREREL